MSDMQVEVVLAKFDDEESATAAIDELKQARKVAQLDFDDSAVIRVDADGALHIKDAADVSTGKGAGRGALFGGVIGLLAGPAGAVLGASAGAVVGGMLNRGDEGFRNEALEELRRFPEINVPGTDHEFRHRPEGAWSVPGTLRIFIFLEQP